MESPEGETFRKLAKVKGRGAAPQGWSQSEAVGQQDLGRVRVVGEEARPRQRSLHLLEQSGGGLPPPVLAPGLVIQCPNQQKPPLSMYELCSDLEKGDPEVRDL